MTPFSAQSAQRPSQSNELVSSDFMALASHMTACQRSQSRFFTLHSSLEKLHAVTASRLVTTGVALAVCSVCLGLLTMA